MGILNGDTDRMSRGFIDIDALRSHSHYCEIDSTRRPYGNQIFLYTKTLSAKQCSFDNRRREVTGCQ
jgi:hypothetical protein